jgi:biotin carboxylase
VADLEQARAQAEMIGYPLMVKASAGGGGRGIRLVNSSDELDEAFERASSEALKTAEDPTVFLERAIRGGGTSRCRSSPMATARYGRWASGTAASSGATRR